MAIPVWPNVAGGQRSRPARIPPLPQDVSSRSASPLGPSLSG